MKEKFLKEGRVNQKLQTRSQILKSARDILNQESKITLEMVAEHAGISRATIYRYFSNIELLTTEALLHARFLRPEELLERVEGQSLEQTIHTLQGHYNKMSHENELVFRRYLSAALIESINSSKKTRGARRVEALKLALEPFENLMSKSDLDRLINISIPRIRDFRGMSPRAFDGRGNYNMGIREQIVFPEINYDKVDKIRGMNVTFVTSAETDEHGRALLRALGMPLRK